MIGLQKPLLAMAKRLVLVMGMIAFLILVLQTIALPSRIVLPPFFPASKAPAKATSSMMVGTFSLLSDSGNPNEESNFEGIKVTNGGSKNDGNAVLSEDEAVDNELPVEYERVAKPNYVASPFKARDLVNFTSNVSAFISEGASEPNSAVKYEKMRSPLIESISSPLAATRGRSGANSSNPTLMMAPTASSSGEQQVVLNNYMQEINELPKSDALRPFLSSPANLATKLGMRKKKKKRLMPPIYLTEMDRLLFRTRVAYRSTRPQWSSAQDQQILAAKAQIENAPIVTDDHELYAHAFRNISMFKRSYELMEQILKVYVYKEGQKPIFHQPLLKGIYASEGWFMKLMETNSHFMVRDPRKAHMFYMPFSSRMLQYVLYAAKSRNKKILEQYLKNYIDMIAAKYPFWNRTGGADHFLAACHDWAPYETRNTMKNSIRALCNADVRNGFGLGKDVSLPETYVHSGQNPLINLGGQPADKRPILAFYAGNMHGSLRPILLQYWENKDPDMKIYGPMPRDMTSKLTYIQHMQTSKFCICPRGYEVNSPRIVESFFYECVPVIISDNYVPPFFEVLNWEAFSVIIPEKDVPRLKEILVSIPREKYLLLQMGVRKVQQHFLWHNKPVKYDAFHMILHSIWFNRVFNMRTR
ncbi:probable glycosyltransferase At3g07620 [Typha latifolia]|uniref:probable glycosyltransferase At3g07620 n=1 Tax=Typha latifolia TaxID=4733 RepID=UPI003C2E7513